MLVHLDTDFLVHALTSAGPERRHLLALAESSAEVQMSAIAWYEFCRGPRTPEQTAISESFLEEGGGVVPFSAAIAARSAEVFRLLGSPRRRAADIAIGVTAALLGARLVTHNGADFADIPDLEIEAIPPQVAHRRNS